MYICEFVFWIMLFTHYALLSNACQCVSLKLQLISPNVTTYIESAYSIQL